MEFEELLTIVGDEPVFETGLLLAGDVDPNHIRRQLSRWTRSGRLHQLRRGLYALAPPYQNRKPHPFLVANHLLPGSYVSLQSALANHGLIPEYVPAVASVTTARPSQWETPFGHFSYRRIKVDYFHGYRSLELGGGQSAFVARPEKAILDLVYLTSGGDDVSYLRSLRLQNLETIDSADLHSMAQVFDRPKIFRAVDVIEELRKEEIASSESL